MFDFMPVAASSWADSVDWVNSFITNTAVFCTVSITAVMIYFGVKYRRRSDNDETAYITHNATLETVWTIIPTIVVIFVFYYGYDVYSEMRTPPTNALEVNVDAYKWRWEFQHPSGKKSTNELVVPLGKPVRLVMTSHDVIHSFYIPAMRVKEDVRGGYYSHMWFKATKLGEFRILCAEYCGLQHSGMLAKLKVVTPEAYQDYITDRGVGKAPALLPAALGKKLFAEKSCTQCHSLDGTKILGPSVKGLFGRQEELEGGETVSVDENYLRESILEPRKKIVKGFNNIPMPAFEGQLSEEEIAGLIAYIKTLN